MTKYPQGIRKAAPLKGSLSLPKDTDDLNAFLLRTLLRASPHYVSGNALAEKMKMSRVGVWSRVDKLRKSGLRIDACQNRGYCISEEPDLLNASLVSAWKEECGIRCPLYLSDRIDSTNSEAERLLAQGKDAPFAVAANRQFKGRGRLGRKWFSPEGSSLYLSLALRPEVQAVRLRNFSLWQGVKVCRFLQAHTGVEDIELKWPNDLVCKGLKIGGMLAEASIDCDHVRSLVFGIGLNVNLNEERYPVDLMGKCASLFSITKKKWRLHELMAKLLQVLLEASEECLRGNADSRLIEEWPRFDFLYGKRVKIGNGTKLVSGIARGIDPSGGLRVDSGRGQIQIAHAGEIEFSSL